MDKYASECIHALLILLHSHKTILDNRVYQGFRIVREFSPVSLILFRASALAYVNDNIIGLAWMDFVVFLAVNYG